jgi:hypothetical protein
MHLLGLKSKETIYCRKCGALKSRLIFCAAARIRTQIRPSQSNGCSNYIIHLTMGFQQFQFRGSLRHKQWQISASHVLLLYLLKPRALCNVHCKTPQLAKLEADTYHRNQVWGPARVIQELDCNLSFVKS